MTVVIVGRGLGRPNGKEISQGDLLLFGGLVYALLGMKSGLNRADMWHIASPMLILIFAYLLPLPTRLFSYSRGLRGLIVALILLIAGTYFIALAPSGSFYARGWFSGLQDTVESFAVGKEPVRGITRAPSVEIERTNPDKDILALGEYLADPSRVTRPVVLYGRVWSIDKRIGVFKTTYPTDDFLLSDEGGNDVAEYLREHGDAFVILDSDDYERLYSLRERQDVLYEKTLMKRILAWTSTVHFTGANLEYEQKAKRWARTVGAYLIPNYQKAAVFGRYVDLESKRHK